MSDLSDALLAGMRAAPKLDPNMLYGVAQSSALDDVPDNATATQAFGDITKRRGYLEAQDHTVQASAWASAGDQERQMLAAAGYKPPALTKRSSGPFAAVGHFLGDTADTLFVKPAELTAHEVGRVLHYAGAPLRQLQHAYRAAALITDQNVLEGRGQWSLQGVFSPSEWAQMWRASEHGEQTFSPVELRRLQNTYDADTLNLAKQLAGGTKVEDIVSRSAPDGQQALVQRIQSDPTLKQAVTDLNNAKLSVGRRIVGTDLQAAHPDLGRVLSGGLDAVADWFGDPLVIGTKFAKGAEIARFTVQGPEDVRRLVDGSTQVQRALTDVSATLNTGGAAALIQRWPKLAPVADQLVREGVDSPEKLGEWFAGTSGLGAMLDGRAGGTLRAAVQMPHLSPIDRAGLAAKGGLRNVIDWASDPTRIAQQTGDDQAVSTLQRAGAFLSRKAEGVKQLTTLTGRGATINTEDPNAITTVQRLANYVLPSERVNDVVNTWAAAETVGEKRQIYKGLLNEMFDAAGVSPGFREKFTSQFDEAVRKPVFSGSGADQVVRNGVETRVGLDAPHFTTEWAMPSFKDLYRESNRVGTLNRVYNGTVNADGVDRFMNNVWKPSMLLRLGFPIRAGGEELVGAIMREGVGGIARGLLAHSAAKGEALGEADRILPFHPLARVWDRYAGNLPEGVRAAVDTPADFAGAVIGDRARRGFRMVEGKLAGQEYMNAARELWRAGPLQEAFTSEIAATESRAAGYLDDGPSVVKVAKRGGNARPAYFAPTGDFGTSLPGDTLYTLKWKKGLDELGNGPLFRAALEGVGGDREAQVQAVVDRIESPGYAKMRDFADRSRFTSDGRAVGVDATAAEANHDWANAVVDHVNSLVHTEQGDVIPGYADRILKDRRGPSLAELSDHPADQLPGPVKGREMVEVSRNWVRDVMDHGFEQVVGRPMDWMVRQPLFIHNYAQSLKDAEALRPLIGAGDLADEHIRQVAVDRAVNKTIPFIHDPQMRSQMSVITRNLAPFWFAQEQFYKRWVNVAKHSPEAFREAQLVMMGLRHSGVLHTDDQGNDFFIYPGPAVVQDALSKGFETLTGKKVSLPLAVGFSGQVRFATPGLERLGVPSFGPLVGIPVHALAQRFPELDQVEAGVLGERGAGRAYWEQITPTTISRLVHVATDSPDTSPQMASAMMQAMAYLEAKGFAPANDASPVEREAYIDRVKQWTRILFLNRTLFGYAAPAAPELQLDPDQLHSRYRELLGQLPIEQATAEFLKEHPDATPYTVFQSKSASGASLPATEHAASFMANNEAFLQTYPQAGGWFVPQTPDDTKFSLPAYREQLALAMRQRKNPEQFYSDLKYAEAADQYFTNRDRKNVQLEGVNGDTAQKLRDSNPALLARIVAEGAGATKAVGAHAQNINQAWAQWKTEFLASHPVFSEQLQSPDAQIQRTQALDQTRLALQDPRLPDSPQVTGIRDLVAAFDDVQSALRPMLGLTTTRATAQRKAIKGALQTWAERYVVDHPEVSGFYNRVLRGQVES